MKKLEKDEGQYDAPAEVFWATGACLMVRSALWKELGGLDSRFFAHMEEIDLCWRAQLKGYKINIVPSSVVWHIGGGTLPASSPRKLKLNYRNCLLMLENNLSRTCVAAGSKPDAAYMEARMTITKRKVLDWCSAAVYLCTGKWSSFKAVVEAHKEYKALRITPSVQDLEQYALSLEGKRITPSGAYDGWIVWAALTKGKKVFEYLRQYENSDRRSR